MKEKLLLLGSVGGAVAATACCWGPLVALTFGLGSFGAATVALGKYTPVLAGAAFLFLAVGFYQAYRPVPALCCDAEGRCAPGPLRAQRVQRASLWVSTMLVFAALGYHFANPAWFAGKSAPTQVAGVQTVDFEVVGMYCEGCATTIQTALRTQKGVKDAQVSLKDGKAVVHYDPAAVSPAKIQEAINTLGYKAKRSPDQR